MGPGPVDVAQGVVLDGRYRIEDVVGHGGMATVYRARDEALGRDVAVKLFPPTPDADELLRHQSEIQVLSHMNHPGLVALHDAGSAYAGGPVQQTYIVMELVPGPTLADLLTTGPLSRTHTARIGRQLAEAIATVHAAEVVHRDIKPANILLVERAAAVQEQPEAALTTGPVVKLADFGIARFAHGARLTMTGTTLGTATYLSPEQATGTAVGPPTDVYALGLVLLECLTGEKAFTGTVAEVAAARLTREPEVPEELGPEWRSLLRAMTAREPEDRVTMADAARGLAELAGESSPLLGERTAVLVNPAATRRPPAPAGPVAGEDARDAPDPRTSSRRRAPGAARPRPVRRPPGPETTQPIATTGPAPVVPPTGGPASGADGGRRARLPVRALLLLAVVAACVVAGVLLLVRDTGGAPPVMPDVPAVEGPLGEAIDDLVESVEP